MPKLYTRADVVALTGMAEGQLKTLARRDQLAPANVLAENNAAMDQCEHENRSVQGWTRWSAEEVVMIAIQARLMGSDGYADGLAPVTAARLAVAAGNLISAIANGDRSRDLWSAYVDRPLDPDSMHSGLFAQGTLPEVALQIEAASAKAPAGKPPMRAFFINVSAVVREVEDAAARSGIDFKAEVD